MSPSSIYERLRDDLQIAQKTNDKARIETLRSVIARIDNASAVTVGTSGVLQSQTIAGATEGPGSSEVARKILTAEDISKLIQDEIDEIQAAIESVRNADQIEYTSTLEKRKSVLGKYLLA